jgi:hypothetical protein
MTQEIVQHRLADGSVHFNSSKVSRLGSRQFYFLANDCASSNPPPEPHAVPFILRLSTASDKIYLHILIEGYYLVHADPADDPGTPPEE